MSENDVNNIGMEEYRIMAQMEASMRVRDNTGFDMAEYKQRCQLIEEQRQQEEKKTTLPYYRKPSPRLPQTRNFSGNDGSSREPPLPFTRANRRYGKSARNRNDRSRVSEICPGVVVPKNSTDASPESSGETHVVRCWGCSDDFETYLRVNILATLVECPKCFTISPVT
mmetsp:Transcript_1545/g.3276  ORF Transcript_1545/g.3276 Transcript_1545/m.3276 type:complete len:169 (+) Transcript_1545:136-642(+)|eukprot:CAMPEP_0172398840 /NCGR_PEP_ID=MMETSP1061-20121228/37903_1 /TAXON_ID=37318 /ORGANISM="Pseudo-nitzschia pungens, Strain cf. pungens" /LENGTH=168 /DNA_ID=CAMNT_0013131485 /DNA_START=54 /DNA_END=560 /DNA_ORIENTATION=+